MNRSTRKKEIILCEHCKGSGCNFEDTRIYDHKDCRYCEGSGRLVLIVTTELIPYKG